MDTKFVVGQILDLSTIFDAGFKAIGMYGRPTDELSLIEFKKEITFVRGEYTIVVSPVRECGLQKHRVRITYSNQPIVHIVQGNRTNSGGFKDFTNKKQGGVNLGKEKTTIIF